MADLKIVPCWYIAVGPPQTYFPPQWLSFQSSELGGRTPKAAFFIGTTSDINTTGDPAVNAEHQCAMPTIAAFDGTNHWVMYAAALHNAFTTIGWSVGRTDKIFAIPRADGNTFAPPTDTFKEADFFSLVPNSVSIKWTKTDGGFYNISCTMFAGDDLEAYAGITPSLGSGAGTTTVTGVGFQPDLILIGNYGGDFASGHAGFRFTFGAAQLDGTQMCTTWVGPDGQNPTNMTQDLVTNRGSAMATFGAATLDYTCLINNFTSDGFDVVTDASASNAKLGFLALKFNGPQTKIWDFGTPTVTGVVTDNTPNFKPCFGMICTTALTATGTPVINDENGNAFGLFSFSNPYPNITGFTHRVAKNTDHLLIQSFSSFQRAIRTPKGDNKEIVNGVNPTFTTTGWTLNYPTVVNATSRMGWALAIEQPPNQGNISQTLPLPSQSGFAYCGTIHREYRLFPGNMTGNFTIPPFWNNRDYKFEAFGGGQAGEQPYVPVLYGGDGGAGAMYGYATRLTAGNFSVGDVLTYSAADWATSPAPRTDPEAMYAAGNPSWIKKPDLNYALFVGGGQNDYSNFYPFAHFTGLVGDGYSMGSGGGRTYIGGGSSVNASIPGAGGGASSITPKFPFTTVTNAGIGCLSDVNAANLAGAYLAQPANQGAGIGFIPGGGGAGFTNTADIEGVESRDGNIGVGGITSTSAGSGGRTGDTPGAPNGTWDTLINGGGESAQTTPLGHNWWVDTSTGIGAAPGGGAAGQAGAFYAINYLVNPGFVLNSKANVTAFINTNTDWGASVVGTYPLTTSGVDGGLYGGGGGGGANSLATVQGNLAVGGRGAPGIVVISWTPVSETSDVLGITDETDQTVDVAGVTFDTLTFDDVTDATITPGPRSGGGTWLTIGGDARTSIFPN